MYRSSQIKEMGHSKKVTATKIVISTSAVINISRENSFYML